MTYLIFYVIFQILSGVLSVPLRMSLDSMESIKDITLIQILGIIILWPMLVLTYIVDLIFNVLTNIVDLIFNKVLPLLFYKPFKRDK